MMSSEQTAGCITFSVLKCSV